jgi:protein-tyrosine kinase
MSKIEDALNRAKLQRREVSPRQASRATPELQASTIPQGEMWPSLVSYEPSETQIAQSRLIFNQGTTDGAVMSYNMLRTRLVKRLRDNEWKSFLISSPDPSAGKSLTALNLAFSIAREHSQRVYLIDADFRRPDLFRILGVTLADNLSTYFEGHCDLDGVISTIGVPRFYLALNNVQYEHSAELLTSPRMRKFVQDLRTRDPEGLFIFDMPPLLVADDVLAFSPQVDAVLLVAAEGQTEREELTESLLSLSEVNLLGVVLNKSKDLSFGSYY